MQMSMALDTMSDLRSLVGEGGTHKDAMKTVIGLSCNPMKYLSFILSVQPPMAYLHYESNPLAIYNTNTSLDYN
jgi:hypothetical protein